MPPKVVPTWQQNLRNAIRRDPKKAYMLGVLLLVLVVAGGRAVMGTRSPASAKGAGAKGGKSNNIVQVKASTRRDSSPAMRRWLATPYKRVDRNLFAARIDYYPTFSGRKSRNGLFRSKELTAEEKLAMESADERRERQTYLDALQLQASEFKLTSTVIGALPQALINGRMVKEGDVVASGFGSSEDEQDPGFRVLKIEPRRVIIEREGIKLEILMK